jgi:hypothetical protein
MSSVQANQPQMANMRFANLNPQQQAYIQQQMQQQQQQADPDQKRLAEIMEALFLINSLREDLNIILDNVGKINSNNSDIYNDKTSKVNESSTVLSSQSGGDLQSIGKAQASATNQSTSATASALQQQSNEAEQTQSSDVVRKNLGLDNEQRLILEKIDTKYLTDKVTDINKHIKCERKICYNSYSKRKNIALYIAIKIVFFFLKVT